MASRLGVEGVKRVDDKMGLHGYMDLGKLKMEALLGGAGWEVHADDGFMSGECEEALLGELRGFNPGVLKRKLEMIGESGIKQDLVYLLEIAGRLGINLVPYGECLNDSNKFKLSRLLKKYEIEPGILQVVGPEACEDAVTMYRIQTTHPQLTAKILSSLPPALDIICKLPKCLQFTGAANLIPTDPRWDCVFKAFCQWITLYDNKINHEPNPAFVENWAKIARHTSKFSEPFKISFLLQYDVPQQLGVKLKPDELKIHKK